MTETPAGIATEMDVLRDVVTALAAVPPAAQVRILKYAREWLELPKDSAESQFVIPARAATPVHAESGNAEAPTWIPNIRTLRENKKPSTNVEMAALVAYYLSELAPEAERSDTLDSSMITKYFKQAGHPIPDKPVYTLRDAKNAGYFDTAERGQYKINPVGYNLVVHGLPREGGAAGSTKRAPGRPRVTAKKAATKPARKKEPAVKPTAKTKGGTGRRAV